MKPKFKPLDVKFCLKTILSNVLAQLKISFDSVIPLVNIYIKEKNPQIHKQDEPARTLITVFSKSSIKVEISSHLSVRGWNISAGIQNDDVDVY